MSELLSCPFCWGDDINIVRTKTIFDNRLGYLVLCADCGCTNGFNVDTEFTAFTDFDTEAEAIDAWNMRAERTCHVVSTTRYDYEGGYAGTDYVTELSCGHTFTDRLGDAPDYCPWCGAKVVEE